MKLRTRSTRILGAALLGAALLVGCATSSTNTTPTKPTTSASSPQTREYHLFTTSIEFNETTVGIPHDTFTPTALFANAGDTVIVHYHNLEDTDEHHTFTMGSPFNVNEDVAPNEEVNVTLHADAAGVYAYVCTYHQPTMTGYLVVTG